MQTATLLRATKSPGLRRVCASHRVLRAFSYTRLLSHTRVVQSEVQFVFPGVAPSFRRCPLSLGQPIESSFTARFFSFLSLSLSLSLSLWSLAFRFFASSQANFTRSSRLPPTHHTVKTSPSLSYPGFDLFVGSRATVISFFFSRVNYFTQPREIP